MTKSAIQALILVTAVTPVTVIALTPNSEQFVDDLVMFARDSVKKTDFELVRARRSSDTQIMTALSEALADPQNRPQATRISRDHARLLSQLAPAAEETRRRLGATLDISV